MDRKKETEVVENLHLLRGHADISPTVLQVNVLQRENRIGSVRVLRKLKLGILQRHQA